MKPNVGNRNDFNQMMATDSKDKGKSKIAKGIVIGGLCSVVAIDFAELCFHALDPVAESISNKLTPSPNSIPSGPSGSSAPLKEGDAPTHPRSGGGSVLSGADIVEANKIMRDEKKQEKEEERKKEMWKRLIRVMLLFLFIYIVVGYLV